MASGRFRAAFLTALVVACGGAPASAPGVAAPPSAPSTAAPVSPATPDPFAAPSGLRVEEWKPPSFAPITTPLGPPPKGLAPASTACATFVGRRPAAKIACNLGSGWVRGHASPALLGMLDVALAESDPAKRDALLADVERCDPQLAVVTRALRAELAPHECADAIVAPLVGKSREPEDQHTLAGLAIAARLLRSVDKPPHLDPPYDAKRVLAFIQGPLKDWMVAQAKLIEALSADAAHLEGYGKGVAAIEAGIADLRFVDAARAVPVPDSIAKDKELKGVYEAQLDQMLEPRKDRGRDAALAGLLALARLGVLKDERVARARALLGRLYAGRRIDALDVLVLPEAASSAPEGAGRRVDERLPAYFVEVLGDPAASEGLGSAFVPSARTHVGDGPSGAALLHAARARLEMAKLYWRAVDVDEAIAAAKAAGSSPEAQLYLALALALRGGPEDAAHMMRSPPLEGLGLGNVTALDAIAQSSGPYTAMAAFDAAAIKRVAAPRRPSADYWRDVAAGRRSRDRGRAQGRRAGRCARGRRHRDAEQVAAVHGRPDAKVSCGLPASRWCVKFQTRRLVTEVVSRVTSVRWAHGFAISNGHAAEQRAFTEAGTADAVRGVREEGPHAAFQAAPDLDRRRRSRRVRLFERREKDRLYLLRHRRSERRHGRVHRIRLSGSYCRGIDDVHVRRGHEHDGDE
jgi:hypothetical protein